MDRGNVQRIGQRLTNAFVCSVFVSLGAVWFKSYTSHSMAMTEIRRSYHRPTSNLPAAPKPWTDPFNTERALQQYPSQLPVTHPQLPNLDTHLALSYPPLSVHLRHHMHSRSCIGATATSRNNNCNINVNSNQPTNSSVVSHGIHQPTHRAIRINWQVSCLNVVLCVIFVALFHF